MCGFAKQLSLGAADDCHVWQVPHSRMGEIDNLHVIAKSSTATLGANSIRSSNSGCYVVPTTGSYAHMLTTA